MLLLIFFIISINISMGSNIMLSIAVSDTIIWRIILIKLKPSFGPLLIALLIEAGENTRNAIPINKPVSRIFLEWGISSFGYSMKYIKYPPAKPITIPSWVQPAMIAYINKNGYKYLFYILFLRIRLNCKSITADHN